MVGLSAWFCRIIADKHKAICWNMGPRKFWCKSTKLGIVIFLCSWWWSEIEKPRPENQLSWLLLTNQLLLIKFFLVATIFAWRAVTANKGPWPSTFRLSSHLTPLTMPSVVMSNRKLMKEVTKGAIQKEKFVVVIQIVELGYFICYVIEQGGPIICCAFFEKVFFVFNFSWAV